VLLKKTVGSSPGGNYKLMRDFTNTFGSFMAAKSAETIAVEFTGAHLRLCIAKASAVKKEIVALIEKEVQSLEEEDLGHFIQQTLAKYGLKNPRTIYVIPSELVITKNIELPSRDQAEIKDIVDLQACRHTPYGREEIAIDYLTVGITAQNYTKILLVIVNRDVVRRNFEILRKAGIEPAKISFFSETMACSFNQCFKLAKEQAPVCIIHVDTAFTVCNVLGAGRIIFVRSIPIGIQHLTVEKEMQQERFAEEIKQSIEVYRNENIDDLPSRVLITGAVEGLKELGPLVNDALKIPAEIVSYAQCFSLSPESQISAASKLSSYLGVLSGAVCFDEIKINLVPEEARLKRLFEQRSKELIRTVSLLLSLIALICVVLLGKIYINSVYLQKINERFTALHQRAEVVERYFTRVKLIRSYLSQKGMALEVLDEFYKLLPKKIKVTEVVFDKGKTFRFKGTAYSAAEILSFAQELNRSEYFSEAKTRDISKRKDGNEEVADFEIIATFRKQE